jgi:CIC family chloride channel protein
MDEGSSPLPPTSSPLRWFPEFLSVGRKRLRSQARLLGSCVLVGLVAGVGAIVFYLACQIVVHYSLVKVAGYVPHEPAQEKMPAWLPEVNVTLNPWLLLLVPTVGGILSGFIIFTFAPEAEGHGTDAVIAAYHYHQGRIRPRVPIVKIIASAITIGTGGSGGREGPIAQIGAGFASFLANVLRLRPADRRVLMAAGMGAGIAAIFRAPLAGALFAAEVLYWSPEFEPEVIIPAGIASVVAYSTFAAVFGWSPLFATPPLTFDNPVRLVPYLLLALFMIVLAMLYTRTFYGLTHLFRRLPVRPHFKPAVGAFLSGLVGVLLYFIFVRQQAVLAVLSFGYGILQDAMLYHIEPARLVGVVTEHHAILAALILLAVALGKIVTTGLTIGSGGSGGVFGPSMVIGGCGGGALGILLHAVWPSVVPAQSIASFVIVGMAGFFAAAAKTPFSTLVIVSEMTGSYSLLLPALWVCAWSFLLSDEQSIYSSQVASRSRSPAHQGSYVREVVAGVLVRQFMSAGEQLPLLRPNESLTAVIERLSSAAYPALPVVDGDRRLLGVVNVEEVQVAAQATHARPLMLAADLMRADVIPLQPGDRIDRALELFVENDLLALPVVDNAKDRRVIGVVKRFDIASAYLRYVHGQSAPVAAAGPAPLPPAPTPPARPPR